MAAASRSLPFVVPAGWQGQPVARVLAAQFPSLPAAAANRLTRQGRVRDGAGRPLGASERPSAGTRLTLDLPPEFVLIRPNPAVPWRLCHEAPELLVVDKPAGVVTALGPGHALDTLQNGLAARFGPEFERLGPDADFGLVHRLDRDTSGLLIVARTRAMQRTLRRQFETHGARRRYLGLVRGTPPARGIIRRPLGEQRRRGFTEVVFDGPRVRPAETRFRCRERFDGAALLELEAVTGRWRQLRAHCAAEGWPLAGDAEHAPAAEAQADARRLALDRLFLHAAWLSVEDPRRAGRRLAFHSPLPDELSAVLERLRARAGRAGPPPDG